MSEIRFYHLQKQSLDAALPRILEKIYHGGYHALVRMADAKEVERMSGILWTYKADAFLPHGTKKVGKPEQHPIWLSDKPDNVNNATVLVLTQGVEDDTIATYNLCCEMLDGRDENAVKAARTRWKNYQAAGHDVTYWHQSETGKWEKKA